MLTSSNVCRLYHPFANYQLQMWTSAVKYSVCLTHLINLIQIPQAVNLNVFTLKLDFVILANLHEEIFLLEMMDRVRQGPIFYFFNTTALHVGVL